MITENPLLAARNILRTIPDELLKVSKDGFYALDREFKYIYWSRGMEKITGLSAEEVRGQNAFKLFPFLLDIGQDQVLNSVFAGESIRVGARKFKVVQTGRVGYFESNYFPLRGIRSEVIGALAIITDVTEQRMFAEMQAETESRFQRMAESSPVMLWMSGQDGMCTFFNQSWLEFSGRTLEQELGVGWAEGVHAYDFQKCMDTYLENFRKRSSFEMEYRLRRSDGVYRWVLDRGIPRYSPDGTFEGYIGSCIDITERKLLEEELRKSIRHREEFLSIASHELKSPLTSLGLQMQILKHMFAGTADLNQLRDQIGPMLDVADRQLNHMSDLIEKLLDVSRIETGNMKMELAETDLVEVAAEVAERLFHMAKGADCAVSLGGMNSVVGHWDRSRLSQVVSNLLSNAIKYASGAKIEMQIECDGQNATLTVSDDGPGIEVENLQRIFEKFQRGSSAHAGGLGLGLFVVQQIVQSHGGKVTAENLKPKGVKFSVELPLNSAEAHS